jgi:hypothetical protein
MKQNSLLRWKAGTHTRQNSREAKFPATMESWNTQVRISREAKFPATI